MPQHNAAYASWRQSDSSLALGSSSRDTDAALSPGLRDSAGSMVVTKTIPFRQLNINNVAYNPRQLHAAELDSMSAANANENASVAGNHSSLVQFHFDRTHTLPDVAEPVAESAAGSAFETAPSSMASQSHSQLQPQPAPRDTAPSPVHGRPVSAQRRSPDVRPVSYVDLLNIPYSQQVAHTTNLDKSQLRPNVGSNASLLDAKKTLDMYRANVKKTQDSAVQYEFALFMVQVAREVAASPAGFDSHGLAPTELLREARHILQRLSDRSYPFAQYYLADGYASGLFNKDKPDYDRAFPLFMAASKHGHAEAGFRAALCYEFGWGCRKDYAKAVPFYRAAASKNHAGAATRLGRACLTSDMGQLNRYREGVKWLKRATESADAQYNQAPFELGLLHTTGFGDDIFKDEVYAVQLFARAADLGNALAALKLGEAYEHGYLGCPKDAALSVHYYNCAAQADVPEAMMNLCAWYLVGAPPVLDKDENEAYEWAKKAAEQGTSRDDVQCTATDGCRAPQGRVRVRLLHRDGHWLPPRSARGQRVVRQGGRPRRRAGQAAPGRHPRRVVRRPSPAHAGEGQAQEADQGRRELHPHVAGVWRRLHRCATHRSATGMGGGCLRTRAVRLNHLRRLEHHGEDYVWFISVSEPSSFFFLHLLALALGSAGVELLGAFTGAICCELFRV